MTSMGVMGWVACSKAWLWKAVSHLNRTELVKVVGLKIIDSRQKFKYTQLARATVKNRLIVHKICVGGYQ